MTKRPWEFNEDLERDRIVDIANLLVEVRSQVIDLHDENLGDTRLSLGMRAYECCRSRIITEAGYGTWPWLSILTVTGRFTFMIGKTPVRFVRNDPADLPSDKLIPSEETLKQMNFSLAVDPHAEIRWFCVIDTFYKNPADNAYFVGYNEIGDILCQWDIPIGNNLRLLSPIVNTTSKPKEIEKIKPSLKLIKKESKKEDE